MTSVVSRTAGPWPVFASPAWLAFFASVPARLSPSDSAWAVFWGCLDFFWFPLILKPNGIRQLTQLGLVARG